MASIKTERIENSASFGATVELLNNSQTLQVQHSNCHIVNTFAGFYAWRGGGGEIYFRPKQIWKG